MSLAFIQAATCITTRGRYNSSLNMCSASYCLAFASSLAKRTYSIFSAASSISSCSAIMFCGASARAVLMFVVIKITEHSLDCSRKLARSAASIANKPLDRRVVFSVLLKISKHYRALISTTQRFASCFILA